MGREVCWQVMDRGGAVIVCTIFNRADSEVEVRAAFSDGTVVRTRRTPNIEAGRTIAAQWLDAIQGDFTIL